MRPSYQKENIIDRNYKREQSRNSEKYSTKIQNSLASSTP